ncbi:LacI family transcriptional regulator [Lachnotalea glycerini]|jgi:LacI family transcriptional regulator, repressor for deo operon, udp, cdd, tsx, nupC, and nupG|uniref:LacI family transcriptional regulator n=1 Tax=Lachnotalea glycerini TaxID=1763509 RepID=A0A255IPF1_9FIRM|nr:LacI family DNA-binding transcriptional regulator [Lachnotalea glycerini]PXV95488.1 LacI family transcriptional regulator [Lachnotalea glycerini]RDY32808.1 LacI family transcriptional regulator [Lachnotalea glycerini]
MKIPENHNSFIGIREIAKLAGVSTATVSRVINTPDKTSPKVREKVEKIIKEYNYIPNQTIKNIFSKTSNSIAIFIYDMENPFFINLIKDLNKICLDNKYTLLILDTENNPDLETSYIEYCISNRCAGIILTEGLDYNLFEPYKNQIPIVSLDRSTKGVYSTVHSNNREMIHKVIDYLYNLNHRKIGFVGSEKTFDSIESRLCGYKEALTNKNIPINPEYIYFSNGLNIESGQAALGYFLSLSNPPTAIICSNDLVALGLINDAVFRNIRIPDTFSIVGFDGVLDKIHYPQITTVRQNIPILAKELFDLITNPPESSETKIVEATFVQGCTCMQIKLTS